PSRGRWRFGASCSPLKDVEHQPGTARLQVPPPQALLGQSCAPHRKPAVLCGTPDPMLLCQNSAPVDRRLIPCVAYERADFEWVYVRIRAIRLAIASNYSGRSQKFFGPAWNKAAHCEVCAPCWACAAGHASERSVAAPDRGKREAKRSVCLSYSRKLGASEVWLRDNLPAPKTRFGSAAIRGRSLRLHRRITPSSSRRPLELSGRACK